jgi:hypothetical protein
MPVETDRAAESRHTVAGACPNCGAGPLRPFYDGGSVPAHSCLLMPSAHEAVAYPKGRLELAACGACGFITNPAFDERLNAYSPDYEETQHFSPHFQAWATALVERLVRTYRLEGKRIVEVGCGKAEFLELMCEMGRCTGTGIDPGCRPERLRSPRVSLIRDKYSEQYCHLPADLIVCRHTLEHIQPTYEFVSLIRRTIGERPDTLVFFEVPDVRRVLRERAFWDIYYEHCSYFSTGSLARLFRRCGFDVIELVRDFDDQYIWLMARPAGGPTLPQLPLEDDLDAMAADVEDFRSACPAHIRAWKRQLVGYANVGLRPVVWGSGSKCVSLFTTAGIGSEVEYVVDINPHRHGKFIPGTGHPIVAPELLAEYRPGAVVAMNPTYRGEIARQLRDLGLNPILTAV